MKKSMPEKRSRKGRSWKRLAAVVLSFVLLFALFDHAFPVSAENDLPEETAQSEEREEEGELILTVVEEIPAMDIEENVTPLAGPDLRENGGSRHLLFAAALLIAVFAYAAYFLRYEQRLIELKKKNAEAEKACRAGETR